MAYRDEVATLRQRVEDLESELGEARATIERLEGQGAPQSTLGARLLGGPTVLKETRAIDGELSVDAHEEMFALLKERFGTAGRITTVGRTLVWSAGEPGRTRVIEVSVAPRDGRTRIEISERNGHLAGGLFGGIVGGVGWAGFLLPLLAGLRGVAWVAPVGVLWLVATWLAVRAAFGAVVGRRARALGATADALADVAREMIAKQGSSGRRARVATDDEDAAAEAEAEQEALDAAHATERR